MSNKKSLTKNAVFNIMYRVLNVIFPLISATYVARVLLPEGVGHVSFAQNIVSYFTMLAALGIPSYGTREISKCRDDQNKTNRVFSELFIINAFSTFICLAVYIFLIITWFADDLPLYLICGLLILFNFINIDWFYQGKEEYAYIAVRSSLVKVLSLLLLFIFVKDQDDYINYALITCLATGGNYVFNIIHARKYVCFTLKNLEFKRHIQPIMYLVICVVAAELYSKVDTTMLGSSCNNQIVGFYTNAQKLTTLVITMTTAISAIFLPRISYYFLQDRQKYNDCISLGVKIVSFFAIPAFLGIIMVSDSLTYVMFGKAFMPASLTIKVLAALILIKSFGDLLCYQVIISSGNEKRLLKAYIFAAAVNICLNALLIPVYQQDGAAFASVVSEFSLNATLFFSVSIKIIHLKIPFNYIKSVMIGTICMGICVFLVGKISTSHVAGLALQVIVGAGVYVLVNVFMKNEMLYDIMGKFKGRLAHKSK